MSGRRRAGVLVALTGLVLTGSGIGWASGITLTSKKLGATALTTPAMFPISLTFTNGGSGVGKPGNGDTIRIVWSQLVDLTTMCSGWTNGATPPSSLKYGWSITNTAGGNDVLAPNGSSGTCASGLHVGSIDLGSTGYNTNATAAIDYPGAQNAISYSGSQTTLLITLGGQTHGTAGLVSSGSAATFTPDAAVTDRTARTCGVNLAQSTTTVQF